MSRIVSWLLIIVWIVVFSGGVQAEGRDAQVFIGLEVPNQFDFSAHGKKASKVTGTLLSMRFKTLLGLGYDQIIVSYYEPQVGETVILENEFLNLSYRFFHGVFEGVVGAGVGSSEAYCNQCAGIYSIGSGTQVFMRGYLNLGKIGISSSTGILSSSVLGQTVETADGVIAIPGINTSGQYIAVGAKYGF